MKLLVAPISFVVLLSQFALSQDRTVSGRVVDEQGKPVAMASVSSCWCANGSEKRGDGSDFDLQDITQLREYYSRLGQMEPEEPTETADDGTFKLSVSSGTRALYAMDSDRTHGCIVEVSESASVNSMVVMQLARLVTVTAEFGTSVQGKSIRWSHAYVELPLDEKNPLANNRLISCGSFDRGFEVRLPPGNYQLDAYGVSDSFEVIDLRVDPAPKFTVRTSDTKLDLGVLDLKLAPPTTPVLKDKSKVEGRWKDFTKHYGQPAPEWHSVDGRGIDHTKNLKALQGKWVLLDFWGLGCAPCLRSGIPKMMDFYHKNSSSRSRFEIVGICIDHSGKIDSIEKLDKALLSIEARVWNGKKIPFPVVLDNTFNTWERYGIPGLGTVVLIDPDGRIVEGDETTLQGILDKAGQ